MRLIDADELKKCSIPCEIHNGALTDLCIPVYQVDNAPTITIKEWKEGMPLYIKDAMLEALRPTGHWVDVDSLVSKAKCSECGDVAITDLGHPNYCPNCGAKMKGAEEGHDTDDEKADSGLLEEE